MITRLRRDNDGTVPLIALRYTRMRSRSAAAASVPTQAQRLEVGSPHLGQIYKLLDQTLARTGLTTADNEPLRYRPHDFRRMFATEAATGGLPVHILARILGRANINTTQAYVAIFGEQLVRSYRAFLDRRRAVRPEAEYREPTDAEWREFQQHFQHEHARIRCPSLRVDPHAWSRLVEIIANLRDRIQEAKLNGWLGEVEGLNVSLEAASRKPVSLDRMRDQRPSGPVTLGMPVITDSR